LDGVFTSELFLGHAVSFALALTSIIGFPLTGSLLHRLGGWTRISTYLLAAGPLIPCPRDRHFRHLLPALPKARSPE
jgi:hypothetical protein